jgi:hypothetical protein
MENIIVYDNPNNDYGYKVMYLEALMTLLEVAADERKAAEEVGADVK